MRKSFVLCTLFFITIFNIGNAQEKDSVKVKTGLISRTNFAPIPIISYNRSYGVSIGAMLNCFTDLNIQDTISPASKTGIGAFYSTNKSWFTVAFQKLYLKEDKIRAVWALGSGDQNFQYLDDVSDIDEPTYVDYSTKVTFVVTSFTYNIFSRFYTGLKYKYSNSTTKFDNGDPDEITRLNGIGIPSSFDNRDYIYNPSNGFYVNLNYMNYGKWLGNDDDNAYSFLQLDFNNYHRINEKGVLASRLYYYSALGSVPFIGEKAVGGKDLRGYSEGTYRSDMIMALQTEYRYQIYKKWGAVAFAGVAETFDHSGLLPAGGVGARYLIIPKRKINAGIDVAVGKGDWGMYFRVSEAF